MSDVYILGAGFSKAIDDRMPSLKELGDSLRRLVPMPDAKEVATGFTDDVELWLTYLSQNHPWLEEAGNLRNRAQFLDTVRQIREILEPTVRAVIRRGVPEWLQSLIRFWHQQRSTIITLNYDTLIEVSRGAAVPLTSSNPSPSLSDIYPVPLAAPGQRTGFGVSQFVDDFPSAGPMNTFQLVKLHGSINWFYSGSTTSAETIYVSDFEPGQHFGGPVDAALSSQVPWAIADLVPFIVPPVVDKLTYFDKQLVRALWKVATRSLREARRVFFLGYSLPATDLTVRFWLGSSAGLRGPFKAYIVNRNPSASSHYKAMLPREYQIDGTYTGGDDAIPRFVADLVGGKLLDAA